MKAMNNKPVSPSGIIWRRLKKNLPAMTGLVIVVVASFISVFCYVLMPDRSPDANEMNLALSTIKPGSRVKFLKVPALVTYQEKNFLERIFSGSQSRFKAIAVDTVWIKDDSLYFNEFTGEGGLSAGTTVRHIAKAFIGSDAYSVNNDRVSFTDGNGSRKDITLGDIREKILHKRIFDKTFVLGTDRFGRDLLSRLMAGTRVSMAVGLIAVFISLIIGVALGALAGFFKGRVDDFIMWLINVVWSIPTLLLVIAITMALGKGFAQVFIAVGLTMWVEVARVVRGQIFSLREMEFVEAGRALGFKNSRIILRHILPNVLSPVIVIAASNFASAILLEAGLSFLGMGAQPPTPSWGMMIKENYGYIIVDAAYLAIYPGLAIMIMVLAFTWLGNGLRDAVDAKEGMGSRV